MWPENPVKERKRKERPCTIHVTTSRTSKSKGQREGWMDGWMEGRRDG